MKQIILASGICMFMSAIGAVHDVRDFGAKGDGIAKDTAAIQKAVDANQTAFSFLYIYIKKAILYSLNLYGIRLIRRNIYGRYPFLGKTEI